MTVKPPVPVKEILESNVELHRIEAPHYEALHPEEYNWFEQNNIRRDILFIAGNLHKPATALDIGCGTGNILLKLLANGFSVRGVDISKEMVEALSRHIPASLEDNVKISVQSADEFLASCTDEFDLVAISSVLHHLPDYTASVGAASLRLKPGGWMYITHEPTNNALGPDPLLRKALWQVDSLAFNILHGRAAPKTEARDYRMSDYHLYKGFYEEKVIAACKASGLDIVRYNKYSSAMRAGLSCWIDSKILNSARHFTLIARKRTS